MEVMDGGQAAQLAQSVASARGIVERQIVTPQSPVEQVGPESPESSKLNNQIDRLAEQLFPDANLVTQITDRIALARTDPRIVQTVAALGFTYRYADFLLGASLGPDRQALGTGISPDVSLRVSSIGLPFAGRAGPHPRITSAPQAEIPAKLQAAQDLRAQIAERGKLLAGERAQATEWMQSFVKTAAEIGVSNPDVKDVEYAYGYHIYSRERVRLEKELANPSLELAMRSQKRVELADIIAYREAEEDYRDTLFRHSSGRLGYSNARALSVKTAVDQMTPR